MRKDYAELLKLSGAEYWNTLEKTCLERMNKNFIQEERNGKPISIQEQKQEFEDLLKHYNMVLLNPAYKSGIDAILDVYEWFDLKVDQFSENANYYLIRNMIYRQAEISRYEALEYGDEWLANQYDGIGEFWH